MRLGLPALHKRNGVPQRSAISLVPPLNSASLKPQGGQAIGSAPRCPPEIQPASLVLVEVYMSRGLPGSRLGKAGRLSHETPSVRRPIL